MSIKVGNTEVILGTMFSGKTSLLLKKFKENSRVERFVNMAFKPRKDTRDGQTEIKSHDGFSIDASPVGSPLEILKEVDDMKSFVASFEHIIVYIDEVQFMDDVIISVIQNLNSQGIDVICCGLNMDRFGKPFGAMPNIMAIADERTQIKTKCRCGAEAYVSFGNYINKDSQVAIGADEYEPVCKKCFYVRRLED
ncbi:hypothetical protein LC065_20115 (plasmid) [Halobacillus litoralis]|uniref:thymidine kinase n=1 Tax=Halobacillus litoralis TaxID=45668 RepID=UPI001CFCCF7E|nr:hypothetical protein [Halobacillus litoralis]WLR49614.1 hypothetical protein LC065_20115 [Halobacillus litoralis]